MQSHHSTLSHGGSHLSAAEERDRLLREKAERRARQREYERESRIRTKRRAREAALDESRAAFYNAAGALPPPWVEDNTPGHGAYTPPPDFLKMMALLERITLQVELLTAKVNMMQMQKSPASPGPVSINSILTPDFGGAPHSGEGAVCALFFLVSRCLVLELTVTRLWCVCLCMFVCVLSVAPGASHTTGGAADGAAAADALSAAAAQPPAGLPPCSSMDMMSSAEFDALTSQLA